MLGRAAVHRQIDSRRVTAILSRSHRGRGRSSSKARQRYDPGVEKHHDFLKVHFHELIGPFDKEGGAHVKVKFREALLLGLCSQSMLVGQWRNKGCRKEVLTR